MKTLAVGRYAFFLTLVLFATLVNCSVPAVPATSPTSTVASPTSTPSPTVIPSPTPSPIPPTRTPRPTLAPTLTADEEQALVLSLLQGNGGCQLPCWWGFTPGETSWQIAETFFALQGKTMQVYSDPQMTVYTVNFSIPQHGMEIWQEYVVNDDTIGLIAIRTVPPIRENEYVYGDAQFAEALKLYMLPQVLAAHGQPLQVFLETFSSTPEEWLPFELLLFYPEKGILVRYYGPAEKEGEILHVCPYQAEVTLWLWSPERHVTLESIVNTSGWTMGRVSDFRSLEEATGMSIEQFYRTFSQPGSQTCLETPADLW